MVVPFKIGVSMCLPAFNEEDNIKKAIDDSIPVLNAISDDWEIVVVDDGSEDGTNKITKEIIELANNGNKGNRGNKGSTFIQVMS